MKLDIGCGPNPREGFEGVDVIAFPNVKHVMDVLKDPWPWEPGSVEEIHCSHFLEHIPGRLRPKFLNAAYRVLKDGAKMSIIVPSWASNRAYGDPTHEWPPVSEMMFYYLDREWRKKEAPHTDAAHWPDGYDCDFSPTWGYMFDPDTTMRHVEAQGFRARYYLNAVTDIGVTLVKREKKKE